jgi:hypothetical protein
MLFPTSDIFRPQSQLLYELRTATQKDLVFSGLRLTRIEMCCVQMHLVDLARASYQIFTHRSVENLILLSWTLQRT